MSEADENQQIQATNHRGSNTAEKKAVTSTQKNSNAEANDDQARLLKFYEYRRKILALTNG